MTTPPKPKTLIIGRLLPDGSIEVLSPAHIREEEKGK